MEHEPDETLGSSIAKEKEEGSGGEEEGVMEGEGVVEKTRGGRTWTPFVHIGVWRAFVVLARVYLVLAASSKQLQQQQQQGRHRTLERRRCRLFRRRPKACTSRPAASSATEGSWSCGGQRG